MQRIDPDPVSEFSGVTSPTVGPEPDLRPRPVPPPRPAALAVDALPIAFLTALYLAAALAAGGLGWPIRTHPLAALLSVGLMLAWLLGLLLIASFAILVLVGAVRVIFRLAGRQPSMTPERDLRLLFSPTRWAGVVVVLALYVLFIDVFVGFKRALPVVHPFSWDPDFMTLDRVLHLGRHPWQWLHPLLGHPKVTDVVDALYYLWFPIKILTLLGFVWCSDRVLRAQFHVSFWLVWIVLGTVMAYALSSAGPCYYSFVTGLEDPYRPLMQYLHEVDATHGLIAVDVQEKLWADYTQGSTNLLMKGISAMPSVHVALPVLYAIAGWRVHRGLGIVFAIYVLVTFLGSIHLGWHYAVDGYVSALVVPGIWWGSGAAVRNYYRRIG